MSGASLSLRVFTSADLGGRSVFRAVRLDMTVERGQGRYFLDVSRGNGFHSAWQRHLGHLAAIGKKYYSHLSWEDTDLFVSARGRGVWLDGASASLPMFAAWLSLLSERSLPEPFFATGVASPGAEIDALSPAPREYIQGKLALANALASQEVGGKGRARVWIPAGSSFDASEVAALTIIEAATLREAAASILGIEVSP